MSSRATVLTLAAVFITLSAIQTLSFPSSLRFHTHNHTHSIETSLSKLTLKQPQNYPSLHRNRSSTSALHSQHIHHLQPPNSRTTQHTSIRTPCLPQLALNPQPPPPPAPIPTLANSYSKSPLAPRPRKLILKVTSHSHPRKLILTVNSPKPKPKLTLYSHPSASIRAKLPEPTSSPLSTWLAAQNAQGPLRTLTAHPILRQDPECVQWANDFYSRRLRIPDTSEWFDGKAAVKAWRKAREARLGVAKGVAKEVALRVVPAVAGAGAAALQTPPATKSESKFKSEWESGTVAIKRESSLDEDFVC